MMCAGCAKVPNDVLENGIAQGAASALQGQNPFAVLSDSVTVDRYEITNNYKAGDIFVYEFTATVRVQGSAPAWASVGHGPIKVNGKTGFRKLGNRWQIVRY